MTRISSDELREILLLVLSKEKHDAFSTNCWWCGDHITPRRSACFAIVWPSVFAGHYAQGHVRCVSCALRSDHSSLTVRVIWDADLACWKPKSINLRGNSVPWDKFVTSMN